MTRMLRPIGVDGDFGTVVQDALGGELGGGPAAIAVRLHFARIAAEISSAFAGLFGGRLGFDSDVELGCDVEITFRDAVTNRDRLLQGCKQGHESLGFRVPSSGVDK